MGSSARPGAEADLCRFRGTCVREGFASLAIIPVRCRREVVAVIHLADEREGIVKGGIVELLETVSPIIGDAIQRFNMESEIRHRLDMEAAMSRLLRLSLEHVSTEELARTAEELLEGMAWLPYRKVSVRLGAAGASTDAVHWVPIETGGTILGSLELAVRPGDRWGSRERRFLESVANLLAGILTRKHAEDQLLRAQRMEMAGKVAGQVAHDLNNLLTPLLGYSQLIANLVTNARDAMGDRGTLVVSTAKVYLEGSLPRHPVVTPGEYVELEVSDTGCGIPAGIVDAIFDPFFSTKTADEKRGSGLGLTIVQSIVEDHGGYLDLESREGEGTVFRVYLPVVA